MILRAKAIISHFFPQKKNCQILHDFCTKDWQAGDEIYNSYYSPMTDYHAFWVYGFVQTSCDGLAYVRPDPIKIDGCCFNSNNRNEFVKKTISCELIESAPKKLEKIRDAIRHQISEHEGRISALVLDYARKIDCRVSKLILELPRSFPCSEEGTAVCDCDEEFLDLDKFLLLEELKLEL